MVLKPIYLKNALVRMCSGMAYTVWVLRADQYAIVRHEDNFHKTFESAQWRKMINTFPVYGVSDADMNSEERTQLDDWCKAMLSGKEYVVPISKD